MKRHIGFGAETIAEEPPKLIIASNKPTRFREQLLTIADQTTSQTNHHLTGALIKATDEPLSVDKVLKRRYSVVP